MPTNPIGPQMRGWHNDPDNSRLDIAFDGTKVAHIDANGLYNEAGRRTESLTVVDDNSTNMTLAAADIAAGINVHTSVTGAGTVTTDTAANIIAGVPLTVDNQSVTSYYVNDGSRTVTFAAADGTVTVADTGNTVLINEAVVLVWRRTSATAVTLYIVTS